jgi:hypothetical protein
MISGQRLVVAIVLTLLTALSFFVLRQSGLTILLGAITLVVLLYPVKRKYNGK